MVPVAVAPIGSPVVDEEEALLTPIGLELVTVEGEIVKIAVAIVPLAMGVLSIPEIRHVSWPLSW